MPNWRKVIVSGSDAALNSLYVKTSTNTQALTASGLIYPTADNGEESFIQTSGTGILSLQYVKTMYEVIYNGEATTIVKGTPVYVSGSVGDAARVFRADAGNAAKMPCVYVSADTIAAGETGRGIALGLIKGVDTTGYPAGTEIFLAVGGGWTSTRPTGSAIVQVLGYVTKEGAGGQGVILNPGPVSLPNLTTNNVWMGNASSYPTAISTASLFVNSASFALTSSNVQGGSTGYIPLWSTNTRLSSSIMYQTGGNIGILTTTPSRPLDVSGEAIIRADLGVRGDLVGYTDAYAASYFINNSGNNSYFNATGGNVGIGITSPAYTLDVKGNIRSRAAYGGGFFGIDDGATKIFSITRETSVTANEMYLLSYGPIAMGVNRTGGSVASPDVYINTSGNLGLGTTSPSSRLTVIGNGLISGSLTVTGSVTAPSFVGTASWASNAVSASYALSASQSQNSVSSSYAITSSWAVNAISATSATSATTAGTVTGTSGQLLSKDDRVIEPNSITNAYLQFGFTAWDNNNTGPYADYLHMRSYIDSSGGNDNLVAFRKNQIGMRIWQQTFNSSTAYTDYRDVVLTSGSSVGYIPLWNGPYSISSSVIYQTGGNIGIGTTSPIVGLDVRKTVIITNPAGTSYDENLRLPEANSGYAALTLGGSIMASGTSAAQWTILKYPTNNSFAIRSNSTDCLYITTGSNVGIGTTSPNAKLDVNGSAIVSGTLTVAPSNNIELQVASTGVKIGNATTDVHNVTGSLNTTGSMTLNGTLTQTPFKSIVIPSLSANATQSREFEILRGITDFNDWSPTGVVEIEVHEQQWGRGLKKTYAFSYGYYDSAELKLVEMIGASTYNYFQLRMGSKTLISGEVYYYPIYAQVGYYAVVDILIKTRRNITTNPVSTTNGDLYVNTAPTASNIANFTADSTVTLSNAASVVDVSGSFAVTGTTTTQNLSVNGTNATFNTTNTTINSSNVVVGNDTADLVGIAGNTMYFPGSGRVGIGTTVPSYKLHVVDNNNTTPFGVSAGSNAHYIFTGNSTSGYTTTFNINDTGLYIGHNSSGRSLNLQTNNTDRLTILGGGNVGIGTTSPGSYLLNVAGNISLSGAAQYIDFQNGDLRLVNTSGLFGLQTYSATTGLTTKMTVTGLGNVGIGTTSPNARLDVSGSAIVSGTFTVAPSNAIELQVTSTGVGLGNILSDSHTVSGSMTLAYTGSGLLLVQDPLGIWADSGRYSYPQFRVPGYRTGITLTDNDEVHVVSNATSVFSTKLEAGVPNIRLDASTVLKWSTSTSNGFTHDVLLRRESPSTLAITGSVKLSNGVTGSLLGTASYATQALSASWAPSAGGSSAITFNRQTASYTLVLSDAGKAVEMNVGSANNLTVPLNSSVAFPVGTEITITQYGAGRTTIVATSGVTLRSVNSWLKANGQYSVIGLLKVATDEWYVYGSLSA